MSVKKAKEIIISELNQSKNGIIVLSDIFSKCLHNQINDDVDSALEELEQEGLIKVEDIRGLFWQLKVIKL